MFEQYVNKYIELSHKISYFSGEKIKATCSVLNADGYKSHIFILSIGNKKQNFSSIEKLVYHLEFMLKMIDDDIPSFCYFPSMEELISYLKKHKMEKNK